jgi:hypothetical protein
MSNLGNPSTVEASFRDQRFDAPIQVILEEQSFSGRISDTHGGQKRVLGRGQSQEIGNSQGRPGTVSNVKTATDKPCNRFCHGGVRTDFAKPATCAAYNR